MVAQCDAIMTRFQFSLVFAGLLVFGAGPLELRADGTNTAPDFKDVYNLIREHLAGVSDAELNRTAVESLVAALRPKVIIEHDGKAATETVEQPPVSKSRIFENDIGYIRISAVVRGLPEAVENADRKSVV